MIHSKPYLEWGLTRMLSSLPAGYQSRSIDGIAAKSPTGEYAGSAAGFAKSSAVGYRIVRGA